jgi:hypothetical protein
MKDLEGSPFEAAIIEVPSPVEQGMSSFAGGFIMKWKPPRCCASVYQKRAVKLPPRQARLLIVQKDKRQ